MSKPSVFENKAFQKSAPGGIGFNLIPQTNSFNSVFDTKPLDPLEAMRIEQLLAEGVQPGSQAKTQLYTDAVNLKQITAEIRAIGKQGIVLMGERVHRARELLKPYKDGTFTRWLEAAFGTRKTGYNVLSYYELYKALPNDNVRERFKKLQQRTAYILASREGELAIKTEIISEYHNRKHNELIVLIQERLPIAVNDRRVRKPSARSLLAHLRVAAENLRDSHALLNAEDKRELARVKKIITALAD